MATRNRRPLVVGFIVVFVLGAFFTAQARQVARNANNPNSALHYTLPKFQTEIPVGGVSVISDDQYVYVMRLKGGNLHLDMFSKNSTENGKPVHWVEDFK